MRKIYLIFLSGLLFVACQKSSVDKKEAGVVRYKETISINDVPPATLTFFEVTDNTCPEGSNCLVAGDVRVDLSLDGVTMDGKITKKLKMCIGCGDIPDSLEYNFAGQDYQLILKSVLPKNRSAVETNKADYSISLDIKKK